jgi:lipopolysaccharide heptosyltransferase II
MKILVRLPNWLGDMVMASGLLQAVEMAYPNALCSVIVKKGIHELSSFFPFVQQVYVFDKEKYKGLTGAYRFGKELKEKESWDLFICLPDSLSSAVMAKATGAKVVVGYKKELRSLFLTLAYKKEKGQHRVLEYISLLEKFTDKKLGIPHVQLHHSFKKSDHVVVNINSEAASRRLTTTKAVEIINQLSNSINKKIILIGAPKERAFVSAVYEQLKNKDKIENNAGETSLLQLTELLATARIMLSTDSGPAHLANALGTYTVVLFGAGNEHNTAPFNEELRNIIRLGALSCEPCQKNICVRYETPQCLERLSSQLIGAAVAAELQNTPHYG